MDATIAVAERMGSCFSEQTCAVLRGTAVDGQFPVWKVRGLRSFQRTPEPRGQGGKEDIALCVISSERAKARDKRMFPKPQMSWGLSGEDASRRRSWKDGGRGERAGPSGTC